MSRALLDFAQDVAALVAVSLFAVGMFVAAIALAPCELEGSRNCRWAEQAGGRIGV